MRRGHFCYVEAEDVIAAHGARRRPIDAFAISFPKSSLRPLMPRHAEASPLLWRARMAIKRFKVAVTIVAVGLLLPIKAAASERPVLISHATSQPVRDMPPQAHRGGELEEKERPHRPHHEASDVVDPVVQTSTTTTAAQGLGQWEGLGV